MSTFLYFVFFLFTLTFILAKDAPWVPTRKKDVARFIALAELKNGQKMYDLGCGDGRLVCAAAEAGAIARGVELSFLPFFLANIRKIFSKNGKNIKFIYRDIWKTDIGDADLVYVWLMPKANEKLKIKLAKELKNGAKVISYVWPIEGWTPIKVDRREKQSDLFLYQL